MLKIKIQQGWVLKRVLAVVANMGPTALMEILPTGLLFRVTNPAQDVSTILGINTAAFHHYSCDEALVFEVNLQQFSSIINSATDDEDITICRSYDTPNLVSFVFVNNQSMSMLPFLSFMCQFLLFLSTSSFLAMYLLYISSTQSVFFCIFLYIRFSGFFFFFVLFYFVFSLGISLMKKLREHIIKHFFLFFLKENKMYFV